ncbi:MAG: protein kinase [Reyranella sp.]|uniref:serine/threonine-protein kinase n=1 Tax=Reyranella sp. TaxID=1929291 RepID=UPI0025EE756D|nr:serine/threonine-protein kinase [Reyranella sp.]MBR2818621.1 protein kinase [Reyranella sp.]
MAADIKAGAKKEELRGTLPAGTRLRNYELISVLGHGGFGITYYAKDTTLGREVAIKEYLPTSLALREDGTMVVPRSTQLAEDFIWGRERFLEEARILATLDGAPAVVRVHDFLEANGTAYMIMGLARGDTLEKRLKDGGCLDPDATEHMLRRLLDGLEAVHRTGFLHRDVKPANIILDSRNDPTLIDFGASRASMADRTAALTAIFTPRYAAAEQLTSDKQGPWTDIYGVSATLYHAITGKAPPSSLERALNDAYQPLSSLEPEGYSPGVLEGIDAGLAVRAKDRPQSIADWRGILFPEEHFEDDETVYERPSKTSQQPRPATFVGGDSTHGKRSRTSQQPRPSVTPTRPAKPPENDVRPPAPPDGGLKALFADKKRVAVAAAIAAVLVLGIGGYLAFGSGSPTPVLTAEEQAAKAQRDAEAKRQAEAVAAQKKAEEDRRNAEAAAAAQKKAEEDRLKAEAAAAEKKAAEDLQKAEAAAAAQKKAEEDRQKADAAAAAQKKADEDRLKAEAAAAQKKAEEDRRKAEAAAAAQKKAEDDRQKAEAAAAAQKKADEDRLKAEAVAAQKKADEDRRKAEAAAAAQKKAEDDRQKAEAAAAAQKKAEEDRLKAEAEAAQRKADEDRRKAEAAAAAAQKKAEDDRQKAEAAAAAQKKAEEDRLKAAEAKQKADAEAAALKLAETTEAALKLSPVDRQRLQVALTSLGFDTQGSDGVFGPRSREMILNWQRARSQSPTTGYLTAAQQQALLGEAAPAVAKFDDDQKKAEAAAKARAATNTAPTTSTTSTAPTTSPRTSNSYGISCQDPSGRRIDYPGESSCPFGFRPVR